MKNLLKTFFKTSSILISQSSWSQDAKIDLRPDDEACRAVSSLLF